MEKEAQELKKWLEGVASFSLPDYKSLPSVPLYMEQVIMYINDILAPLSTGDKNKLTSFMVNNYVKAGMIRAPEKKKYTNDHLGYLLAVSCLKDVLSMTDLSLLIEMDSSVSSDKSVLYRFFASLTNDVIQDKAKTVLSKIESYEKRYENEVASDSEKAESNLRDALGLTAFRLAVQAEVYQVISKAILRSIADDMHGEDVWAAVNSKQSHEVKREMKISMAESERIAKAKQKQQAALAKKTQEEEKKKAEIESKLERERKEKLEKQQKAKEKDDKKPKKAKEKKK